MQEYPGALYHDMNCEDPREERNAERIVKEETGRLGWYGEELRVYGGGRRAKVMLARRVRQETTMSLKWIAQGLYMGSWTYVSNLLNELPQTHPQGQEELPLCQ